MTWANFYLFCFLVGLLWSAASFLLGHLDFPVHGHGAEGGHFFHGHFDHGVPPGHGGESAPAAHAHSHPFSPINFGTMAAFLAWFGGMGYLLTAYSALWFVWGLGLATLTGLGGAMLLFLFVSKVLMSGEQNPDPADYNMVGMLGRICSPVREGGTGEMIYVQDGARQTCGVRSEEGRAIAKGVEVVVTRYEKGIAYVRPWDDMTGIPVSGCPDESNPA
jgi:hypothetical protein